jgi:hypothetical protein
LDHAEEFMNTYAAYKAGGKDTPWSRELMSDMNRVTKGYEIGKRANARILDGGKRILSGITDEKR